MSYKPGWKPGRWSVICDRCGFRFHSDAIKTEWTGLKVCGDCWEMRNPQDFLRVHPEKIVPPWTRPESQDVFVNNACTIYTQGGADYAEADCAQADAIYPL
jgi:hypothetical protein